MADHKRLDGRAALITGGGRGIGRQIALAYAAEGARLSVSARTAAEQYGSEAITIVVDTNKEVYV